jgi:tol-pal system protein YbgF
MRGLRARSFSFLLAPSLLLAGCASVAEVTGTATQQDLMQLRSEFAALQLAVQRSSAGAQTASNQTASRVRDQGLQNEREIAALATRLDSLATSITALSTRVDDLGTRVEAMNRQSRAAVAPTPTPGPRPTPTVTPPPGGATPAATPATSRATTSSLGPQDLYQAAYIDYSKGSYSLAIAGFREFLRRYPEHELADNAQYWIGEAHFSLARGYANAGQQDRYLQSLEQAVQEFRKVVANYPRGDKSPTALYKEALALIELKQPAVAHSRLQYLVENFPQAEETPLARERLASLRDR